jgi:putative membrane protein
MRSAVFPAAALALLAACSPDHNRQNREVAMLPSDTAAADRGDYGATTAPLDPGAILSELDEASTAEIQTAELVARKASTAQVKKIARKLVADHTRNREELRAVAQKLSLPFTPVEGDRVSTADSVTLPPELGSKIGVDFDRAFVEYEIGGHLSNIDRIKTKLLPTVQNQPLKTYLQRTLTEMESHLAALKQLEERLRA